ncbi:MAG: hypothetical protein NTU44_09655 [Bacteroidetes bacterium]|nr:hypothetical protein [Bacteroidota bacterium]
MTRKQILWLLPMLLIPFTGYSLETTSLKFNLLTIFSNLDDQSVLIIGLSVFTTSLLFIVLFLLYRLYKRLPAPVIKPSLINRRTKTPVRSDTHGPTDEEAAAIGLALHLYVKEIMEQEEMTLTIKRVSRVYSPWSSKIYGINSWPRTK